MTVAVPQPFDFHLTVGHQTYYRGRAGADLYVGGTYYRALHHDGRVLAAAARPVEDGLALQVRLPNGGSQADLAFATERMVELLGLGADLAGFYRMLADDTVLAQATASLAGLRPSRTESVFEALVMAIVAQQISAVIARMIRESLVTTYGTPVEADGHTLYAFPKPESLLRATVEELRGLKLSGRKIEYIQDCAGRTVEGLIDPARLGSMDDEEAIAEMTKVRGIGRWTAEWVLMRALGRLDVLPAGDLALRRVVSELYLEGAAITEKELADFAAERWRPYRGLATTYLFAYLRQQRVAKEAAKAAPEAAF